MEVDGVDVAFALEPHDTHDVCLCADFICGLPAYGNIFRLDNVAISPTRGDDGMMERSFYLVEVPFQCSVIKREQSFFPPPDYLRWL